jgi:hypothetical protein
MSNKINVLVFPAGEINSIELHDSLSTCVNINLFGASSIDRHGEYVFKNYISGVPFIDAPDFIERFNEIIDQNKIDLVFPTHDTIALFFSENADKIHAKIIVADRKTAEICRDKEKTYDEFKDFDFIPEIYTKYTKIDRFPVFIKPRKGQGGVGAKLIQSENDLPFDINLMDYVICEYLPGEEYTVDCLTDKNGKLIYVSPRSRKRLLAGVTVSGRTEELTPEIKFIADTINNKLSFMGLWWFQIKKDADGKWKLMEISTRIAGTMCLTRAKGVNLPLLSVYIAMGYDVEVLPNNYRVQVDRTLISRYKINYDYEIIYIDLDDTILINGEINLNIIRFIYQCFNKKKKIILLTKHDDENVYDTLSRYNISDKLFHEIIQIPNESRKSEFIENNNAIFIDNSFIERKEVYEKHKIPVFDVDGIEVLLDWRC